MLCRRRARTWTRSCAICTRSAAWPKLSPTFPAPTSAPSWRLRRCRVTVVTVDLFVTVVIARVTVVILCVTVVIIVVAVGDQDGATHGSESTASTITTVTTVTTVTSVTMVTWTRASCARRSPLLSLTTRFHAQPEPKRGRRTLPRCSCNRADGTLGGDPFQARNFTEEQMSLARAMPARWTNLGRSLDVKDSPARGLAGDVDGGAPAAVAAASE